MQITVRECLAEDLPILRELSYKTYNDTFGNTNTPSNMKAYLDKAFDLNKLREELANDGSTFYFLCIDGRPTGYLKLNEYLAQTDIHDEQSLEIERIYVTNEFHGKGLGSILMDKAIEVANAGGKKYLWLGVWERNEKALQFYKRKGFYVTGRHPFFMGEEEQTDFIMRRDL